MATTNFLNITTKTMLFLPDIASDEPVFTRIAPTTLTIYTNENRISLVYTNLGSKNYVDMGDIKTTVCMIKKQLEYTMESDKILLGDGSDECSVSFHIEHNKGNTPPMYCLSVNLREYGDSYSKLDVLTTYSLTESEFNNVISEIKS